MRCRGALALLVFGVACGSPPPSSDKPSVLLVVVDTLRADRLEAYGHATSTMPEVSRRLVDHGVLFENAWSQAPWTLPSMVAMFSGRRPGRDLAGHPAAFAFPAGRPTPAELFAAAGWATAAFVGNPLLGSASGFDRGFESFWVAPNTAQAMDRTGADVTDRAIAFLRAESGPFFLWTHYIDPHDPYLAPELVRGLPVDDPTYRGTLSGRDVHALFNGRLTPTDPERDARFMASLYDAEIRHVDREIGRLLDALGPRLANTAVLLVSDHGEELSEHGGWKHGRTVFQEQLHVPLIVRWDGHIAAAGRITQPVSLVDVVPTLAEIAGIAAPPDLDGESLLRAVRGDGSTRPMVAAHWHTGPRRFTARVGRHKLLLFDREAPSNPESPLEIHLDEDERRRIPPLALFDLERDPGEQVDLAASRPDLVNRLALVALDGLDQPGRVLVMLGLEKGKRWRGTLEIEATRWERLLLGAQDSVVLGPESRLHLDLLGDGRPKALVLPDAAPLWVAADGWIDGGEVPPLRAVHNSGLTLATWYRPTGRTTVPRERDPEVELALRSLGYLQ